MIASLVSSVSFPVGARITTPALIPPSRLPSARCLQVSPGRSKDSFGNERPTLPERRPRAHNAIRPIVEAHGNVFQKIRPLYSWFLPSSLWLSAAGIPSTNYMIGIVLQGMLRIQIRGRKEVQLCEVHGRWGYIRAHGMFGCTVRL